MLWRTSAICFVITALLGVVFLQMSGLSQSNHETVKSYTDLSYVPNSKLASQTLDLFVPEKGGEPYPLIVFIHGGGWTGGDKKFPHDLITDYGYAFASINYRLSQEAIFPAQIYDCKAAIRWLRANARKYHIDPKRIGVWGSSAGGHLVALLGTTGGVEELEGDEGNLKQSSLVQAACDWCGPTDLLDVAQQAGSNNKLHLGEPRSVLANLLGGTPKDKQELAKLASPVNFCDGSDPPFLIMHGDADDTVPIGQSEELYQKLQDSGVQSQFIKVAGAGHSFGSPKAYEQVRQFFDSVLKKPQS